MNLPHKDDLPDNKTAAVLENPLLHRLAELISDAIFIIDKKRRILFANTAALNLTTKTESEILNQELETLFRLEQTEAGKSFHVVHLQLPKTGTLTVRTEINGYIYQVKILRIDILQQARELCTDACGLVIIKPDTSIDHQVDPSTAVYTQILGFLTLRIAHDFNNSLTSIIGNAQLVEEFIESSATNQEADPIEGALRTVPIIQDVVRKALEMGEFVKTLQDYARQRPVAHEALDLNLAIREALIIATRILGNKIKTEFLPGNDIPPIIFEKALADQIVFGLLFGSKESMPKGGRLTIETEFTVLDPEFADKHPGSRPGEFIRLSVSNNGVGIDQETLTGIFDPSFLGIKHDRAIGLSLPTVYAIIKQSGGYIEVESWLGKGSRFDVYLPMTEDGSKTADSSEGFTETGVQGEKTGEGTGEEATVASKNTDCIILVAEDDTDVQRFIERYITKAGFRVKILGRGDSALVEYKNLTNQGDRPVLVIADLGLPGIDGRTLFRKIREFDQSAAVLLTSGYRIEMMENTGKTEEGYDFIQKPFESETLIKRIESILQNT